MAQLEMLPGGWLGTHHRIAELEAAVRSTLELAFTTDTEPGGSPGTNEGIDEMDGSTGQARLAVADEYPHQFEQVHNLMARDLPELQDWIEGQSVTELRSTLSMAQRVNYEHTSRAAEASRLESIIREQLNAASHHNEVLTGEAKAKLAG